MVHFISQHGVCWGQAPSFQFFNSVAVRRGCQVQRNVQWQRHRASLPNENFLLQSEIFKIAKARLNLELYKAGGTSRRPKSRSCATATVDVWDCTLSWWKVTFWAILFFPAKNEWPNNSAWHLPDFAIVEVVRECYFLGAPGKQHSLPNKRAFAFIAARGGGVVVYPFFTHSTNQCELLGVCARQWMGTSCFYALFIHSKIVAPPFAVLSFSWGACTIWWSFSRWAQSSWTSGSCSHIYWKMLGFAQISPLKKVEKGVVESL